jgi:hypothetical protein
VPQGSRCASTLGYLTKSLRDKKHPNYHKAGLSLNAWAREKIHFFVRLIYDEIE